MINKSKPMIPTDNAMEIVEVVLDSNGSTHFKQTEGVHTIQRLMLSKGAKWTLFY